MEHLIRKIGQLSDSELIELLHRIMDEIEARLMQNADVRQS